MINVVFKNGYNNTFGGKEYVYKDYDNAEVGDIVAVNTCNGLAIAKVTKTDIFSFEIDEDNLKTVEKVVKSAKEQAEEFKAKYEKTQKIKAFIKDAKRQLILKELKELGKSTEADFLDTLSLEDLENMYFQIK